MAKVTKLCLNLSKLEYCLLFASFFKIRCIYVKTVSATSKVGIARHVDVNFILAFGVQRDR